MISKDNPFTKSSEFELRNLGFHLARGSKNNELHQVLSLTTERRQNAYLEALESIGYANSFLENIKEAWQKAEKEYKFSNQSNTKALALQFRYGLITSTFNTFTNDFPDALLELLAKNKKWSATQCKTYIFQRRNEDKQLEVLASITPHYPELLPDVLKLAESIDDYSRVWVIIQLLSHFPGNSQLLRLSLDSISSLNDLNEEVEALTKIAKVLPDSDNILLLALEKTRDIQDDSERVEALEKITSLAQIKPIILAHTLVIVKELQDLFVQISAVEKILPSVDDELIPEFLEEIVSGLNYQPEDILLASQMVNTLVIHFAQRKPEESYHFFQNALYMASLIENPKQRVKSLVQLGPHLPEELLLDYLNISKDIEIEEGTLVFFAVSQHLSPDVLPDLFELLIHIPRVEEVEEYMDSYEVFGRVFEFIKVILKVPAMPLEVWSKLLDTMELFPNKFWILYSLSEIAHLLPKQLLVKTMKIVNSIEDLSIRILTLQKLATNFPEILTEVVDFIYSNYHDSSLASSLTELAIAFPDNQALLEQALTATRAIFSPKERADAFVELAVKFPELVPEALTVVKAVKEEMWRRQALEKLLPIAPDNILEDVLIVAKSINDDHLAFFKAIRDLAIFVPEEMSKVLTVLETLNDDSDKQEAICLLIPYLPTDLLPLILEEIGKINDEYYQSKALKEVIASLGKKIFPHYLSAILLIIRSFEKADLRAKTLRRIAPYCPEVWSEAVQAARLIENTSKKVEVLKEFLVFSPSLRQETLEIALSIEDKVQRALALIKLVPFDRGENLIENVFEILSEIPDIYNTAVVLNKLIPHLPDSLRQQILPKALELTLKIKDNHMLQELEIGHLLPNLSEELLEELLTYLETPKVNFSFNIGTLAECVPESLMIRTVALFSQSIIASMAYERIAPRLPDHLKSEVLEIALAMKDRYTRVAVLKILIPYLPSNLIPRILDAAETIAQESEEDLARLYSSLAPKLLKILPEYSYRLWLRIISPLSKLNRKFLLEEMSNLSYILNQLGGKECIIKVIESLEWVLSTSP
jgi:hypothetical protein